MAKTERIHFGWFIRWARLKMSASIPKIAKDIGVETRTYWGWEQMQEPEIYADNLAKLAKGLGWDDVQEFIRDWKKTPVAKPPSKSSGRMRLVLTAEQTTKVGAIAEQADRDGAEVARLLIDHALQDVTDGRLGALVAEVPDNRRR